MSEETNGVDTPAPGGHEPAATLALLIASAAALGAVAAEVVRRPDRWYVSAVASFDLMIVAAVAGLVAVVLAGTSRRSAARVAGMLGAVLAVVALASRSDGGQTVPAVRLVGLVELLAGVAFACAAWPGVRSRWPGIVPLALRATGCASAGVLVVLALVDLASGPVIRSAREREQLALLVVAVVALTAGAIGSRVLVTLAACAALAVRVVGGPSVSEVVWLVPLVLSAVLAVVPADHVGAAAASLRRKAGSSVRAAGRRGRSAGARGRRAGSSIGTRLRAAVSTRSTAASPPPRSRLADLGTRERWVAVTLGVATVAGVTATIVRARQVGWFPIGDDAIIATLAGDVGTPHTPLLGLPTTLGPLGPQGLEVHHPGPFLLWITSPFVRLLGPALGVMVAAASVNLVALGAGTWAAFRARGATAALLAYGTLLAVALTAGSGVPFEPLNAYVPIIPLAAVLLLGWSASCGVRGALPWAVGLASLCVQAYLPLAPTALAAVAFAFVATAVPRVRPNGVPSPRRTLVAALAVGLVAWSGPIIDALANRGGNLRALLDLDHPTGPTLGPAGAGRALLWLVGIPPGWLRPVPFRAEDASVYLAGSGLGGLAVLVVVGACACWRWRTWDQGLRRVLVLGAVSLGVGAATLGRLPTSFVFVYQVGWIGAVGAFALLAVALVVVDEAGRVPSLHRARVVARSSLVVGVAALLLTIAWPRGLDHYASVAEGSQEAARELSQEVGDGPRPGRPIAVLADGRSWEQVIANGVAMSLADRGRDIRVTPLLGGHWGTFRLAEQRAGDPVLIISDGYSPEGPGVGEQLVRFEPSGWSQEAADATSAKVAAWARAHGPVVPRPGLDGLLRSVAQGWVPDLGCDQLEALQQGDATFDDLPDGAIAQLYLEGVVASPALPDALFEDLERNLVATPTEVWLADASEARATLDGPLARGCL